MTTIEALYEAAGRAGLLQTALWRPTPGTMLNAWVEFRAPDTSILDGLGLSTDYAMRYPVSRLQNLKPGDAVEVGGQEYQVREVRAMGDGSEVRATLARR